MKRQCMFCRSKTGLMVGVGQCEDFIACQYREAKARERERAKTEPRCTEAAPNQAADRGHRFEKTGEMFAGDVMMCAWCNRKDVVRP